MSTLREAPKTQQHQSALKKKDQRLGLPGDRGEDREHAADRVPMAVFWPFVRRESSFSRLVHNRCLYV